MADTMNTEAIKADDAVVGQLKRFSLVELLMIIMLVGIAMTLLFPRFQENARKERLKQIGADMKEIAELNVKFKANSGNYAEKVEDLGFDKTNEDFTYSLTSAAVVATSTAKFGKEGMTLHYLMPGGPFYVPKAEDRGMIDIRVLQ